MASNRLLLHFVLVVGLVAAGTACGTGSDAGNVLTITEREYAFEVEGEARSGTLTIEVENTGKEWHELAMVKLKRGKTLADARKALEEAKEDEEPSFGAIADENEVIDDLGGLQFPGTKYGITGTGIASGDYALMCFLPNAQGKPHWSLGMLAGFTVADERDDEAPEADVTFTVDDKGLDGPERIDAGQTTMRVVNNSKVSREIGLLKIEPGKTVEDVMKSFESSVDGPPDPATAPLDFVAFVFDAEQDRSLTVELTPGQWAINSPDPEKPSELPLDNDPFAVVFSVS